MRLERWRKSNSPKKTYRGTAPSFLIVRWQSRRAGGTTLTGGAQPHTKAVSGPRPAISETFHKFVQGNEQVALPERVARPGHRNGEEPAGCVQVVEYEQVERKMDASSRITQVPAGGRRMAFQQRHILKGRWKPPGHIPRSLQDVAHFIWLTPATSWLATFRSRFATWDFEIRPYSFFAPPAGALGSGPGRGWGWCNFLYTQPSSGRKGRSQR